MKIEVLREFIEFSSHLNVSSVARTLHISQSSLSRHLIEMEKELKVQLVEREGRKVYLTKAGRVFLDNIIPIVQMYDFAVEASKQASKEADQRLVIQEFAVRNASSTMLYEAIVAFKKQYRNCEVDFLPLQRHAPEEALKKGLFDVAQVIVANSDNHLESYYKDKGLVAIPLITEPALVWMSVNNPLVEKSRITLDDLITETFCVAIGEIYDPMIEVISQIYYHSGMKPRLRSVGVDSMAEFFIVAGDYENCVHLVTPQYAQDSRLLVHSDRVFKEIDDERALLTTCLLYLEDCENPMVFEFVELVKRLFGVGAEI